MSTWPPALQLDHLRPTLLHRRTAFCSACSREVRSERHIGDQERRKSPLATAR